MAIEIIPGDIFVSPWGAKERIRVALKKTSKQVKSQYFRLDSGRQGSDYHTYRHQLSYHGWTYIGNINQPDNIDFAKVARAKSRELIKEEADPDREIAAWWESDREPSDDEIYNRHGVEGGIPYSEPAPMDEHDPRL